MSSQEGIATTIRQSDYESWSELFRAYLAHFDEAPISEDQYLRTFERLMDPDSDLDGFVLREVSDESRVLGLIHFCPRSNSHSERRSMFITDLFVDPSARNRGFANELGKAVLEETKRRGYRQLDWAMHHGSPIKSVYDRVGICARVLYRIPLGGV